MTKTLLLSLAGLALTTNLRAQSLSVTDQVRLPGQRPTDHPLAAQAGSVSQLQVMLLQNSGGGVWTDFSRYVYQRYRTATLPGLIRTDHASGTGWMPYFAHRYQYTTAGEMKSDTTDQYREAPYGAYTAVVGTFNTPSQRRED